MARKYELDRSLALSTGGSQSVPTDGRGFGSRRVISAKMLNNLLKIPFTVVSLVDC